MMKEYISGGIMAIQDSFNISNALNSQSYAYKCWYNYNYGNNTMGISAKDMGQITQTWNSQLDNWRAVALDDENAYEIEDDDFSRAKKSGRDNAEEKSGHDGSKGGMIARGTTDAAVVGAVQVTKLAAKGFVNKLGEGVAKAVGQKVGGEAVKEGVKGGLKKGASETAKKATKAKGSWSIEAPLALAMATLYQAKKPNKTEKEACDKLQDEMVNSQNALMSAQDDMTTAGDEVTALADEAQMLNEDANNDIEDKKSEYDTYKATYDALMAKVEAGETLTEDEKELLKELAPIMQELGEGIGETQEDATDLTGDIYDEMGTYQDTYNNAAETVAEVQGVTDFAESFDSATRTMCYVEAGAQTLNAASGIKAGVQAGISAAASFGFNAWAWACAAMGASAGVMSGLGAKQQFQWAGEVGTEIGMRKDTQDFNATTNDIYDESIENYDGMMTGVEDLELEIPKDMEDFDETMEGINEGATVALSGGEGDDSTTTGGSSAFGIVQPTSGGNSGSTPTTGGSPKDDDKDKEG